MVNTIKLMLLCKEKTLKKLVFSVKIYQTKHITLFEKYTTNCTTKLLVTEAVTRKCSVKKVFLENSQNSQKNTCARVFFLIKLQAIGRTPPMAVSVVK